MFNSATQTVIVDLLRLLVWLLLLLAVFGMAEKRWPLRPQPLLRRGWATDLGYFGLSGLLPKLLLAVPLSLLAALLHHVVPSAYYAAVADWPLAVRLLLALVVSDIGAYWGHRLAHQLPWLWRLHAVHHSAEQMDWLVNTRAHPLDMGFQRFCGLAPTYVLGLSQPTAGSVDWAPLLLVVIGTGWGFFVHANLNWRLGWLERVISSPGFHHWHHSGGGPAEIDKNFAAMLPAIDLVFGTFYLPKHRWPATYGTQTPVSSHLIGQLIDPLLPARKPQGNGMASLGKR